MQIKKALLCNSEVLFLQKTLHICNFCSNFAGKIDINKQSNTTNV